MESPTTIVAAQQKRKRGPAKGKTTNKLDQPAVKKTRQTTKWKSPLLKIYNENVVSIDEIRDLGSISYVPMAHNTTKQKLTISFKYKRHEPIVICVDQDDLKSVTKRVKDYARKYGTTLHEGDGVEEEEGGEAEMSEDDEKEDKGKQLELEMQMYENGDMDEEAGLATPEPKPAPTATTTTKSSTTQMTSNKPKAPKAKIVKKVEPTVTGPSRKPKSLAPEEDDEMDDVFNDSDAEQSSSDESARLHSPEAMHA